MKPRGLYSPACRISQCLQKVAETGTTANTTAMASTAATTYEARSSGGKASCTESVVADYESVERRGARCLPWGDFVGCICRKSCEAIHVALAEDCRSQATTCPSVLMCLVALKSMSHPCRPRSCSGGNNVGPLLHCMAFILRATWPRIELSRTTAATAAVSLVPRSAVYSTNRGKC